VLAALALRLPAGAARRRTSVVAVGVLVWFGSATLGSVAGFTSLAWEFFSIVVPPAVGISVLLVYRERGEPEVVPPSSGAAGAS
jgi:hypothetical protein